MNERTHSARGSILFALLFVALSLFLVSQLGEEAKFSSKGKLFAQPAFWPGVGVIGMAFFGCLNLIATIVQARRGKYGSPQLAESQPAESRLAKSQPAESLENPGEQQSDSYVSVFGSELKEGASWLLAFEYFAWFMLYVYATPVIGYLAATVLFLVALTFRVGYRDKRMTIAAVATGFAIVLIFKSFLGVKIPGGAVYESLPDTLRSFMIINF